MITCAIPTMWLADEITASCDALAVIPIVTEVLVINNDESRRFLDLTRYGPETDKGTCDYGERPYAVKTYGKFTLLTPPSNVYVGESWNVGVVAATNPLVCLLNDDVVLRSDTFEYIAANFPADASLIGAGGACDHLNLSEVGSRCYGFGVAMFLRKDKYIAIPNSIRIWYTDDFLFENMPGAKYHLAGCIERFRMSTTVHSGIVNSDILVQDRLGYLVSKRATPS